MSLTDDQRALLDAPLNPQLVKTKPTPGNPKYIEGHEAMNNANRIFGYDGWGYTVDRIDRMEAPGGVLYSALVSVTVEGCHTKQDIGVEIASQTKDGKAPGAQAHDTALKGAVTDGIKRALRSFGDQFGASLYDKDADLNAEYRDWQRGQGREQAPRGQDDPWNIQAEVREEIAARADQGTPPGPRPNPSPSTGRAAQGQQRMPEPSQDNTRGPGYVEGAAVGLATRIKLAPTAETVIALKSEAGEATNAGQITMREYNRLMEVCTERQAALVTARPTSAGGGVR